MTNPPLPPQEPPGVERAEPAEPVESAAPAPPRPGAQAASRARRIGGRPRPRAGPDPAEAAPPGDTGDRPEPDSPAVTDTAPQTDEEAEPPAAHRGRPAARRARPRWLPWALAVVAVLVVGALAWADVAVYQSWQDRNHGSASAREQLLSQVKSGVARVISYDYRHVDADAAAAAARLTGPFKQQYLQSIRTVVKPGATKQKVVVAGQVTTAGVTSVDGNQATVVVFAQQTVTKAGSSQPQVDPVSIVVTADRVHGAWLIADIKRK